MADLFDVSCLQEITPETCLWIFDGALNTRVGGEGVGRCSSLCAFPRRSGNKAQRPRSVRSSLL